MKRALDKAFVSLATAYLSRHPEIRHEWREIKEAIATEALERFVELLRERGLVAE